MSYEKRNKRGVPLVSRRSSDLAQRAWCTSRSHRRNAPSNKISVAIRHNTSNDLKDEGGRSRAKRRRMHQKCP
jgi:hypothetical protein